MDSIRSRRTYGSSFGSRDNGSAPRQDNLVFMCLDANDPRYLNTKALVTEQR